MARKRNEEVRQPTVEELREELAVRKAHLQEEAENIARIEAENGLVDPQDPNAAITADSGSGFFDDPAFIAALEEMGSEGRLEVQAQDGAEWAKAGSFPLENWRESVDSVARTVGGGRIRLWLRDRNGVVRKRSNMFFHKKFYNTSPAAESAPPKSDDKFLSVLAEMQKQTVLMAQQSKNEMMELMRTVLTAQLANTGANSGLIKNVQDVAAIRSMFEKKDDGVERMLDLFKTGLDMGKRLTNGSEPAGLGETILNKLIDAFGKPLAEGIVKATAAPRAGTPGTMPKPFPPDPARIAAPAPAAPAEPAAVISPQILDEVEKVKKSIWYVMYVPVILRAAEAKEDPAKWAGQILDRVPEDYHGILLDTVSRPDLVDFLATFEPDAVKHTEWVQAVAEGIRGEFEVPPAVPVMASDNGKEVALTV